MNCAHRPFFSVLIPSYNRPEYIAECVNSVLANEGEDYELIIADDASPSIEAIEEAVRPYLTRPNVRFHRHQSNLGEPGNRNFLVAQATGEYNIILADDDKLFPHTLRTIRSNIERLPDQDLYMFGYQVINESGSRCYERVAPGPLAIHLDHPQLVRRMFEGAWLPFLVCHPATFCCKRGIETEVPYRQDVSTADDYMFLLECLNQGKRLYVIPECLMSYRWFRSDKANQINQSSDTVKVMQAYTKVYYALQRRTDLHPSLSVFVQGSRYRQRFLYDLIARRTESTENIIAFLNLQPGHDQELAKHGTRFRRWVVLLKAPLVMAYELMQHFGLHGLLYSSQLWVSYLKHRGLAHGGL